MRKTVQIPKIIEKELPNLHLTKASAARMELFLQLLHRWNAKINLTAIRSKEQQFAKHILDSLAIGKCPTLWETLSGKLLDMGSGAGLPGIPLSIAKPELEVFSIDKSQRKITFQQHVRAQLQLGRFHPVAGRLQFAAQSAIHKNRYDVVVSRALDKLTAMFRLGNAFLKDDGKLIVWKGRRWREEYRDVPSDLKGQYRMVEKCRYRFEDYGGGGTILCFAGD